MIRWLRPEFQNRDGMSAEQATIGVPNVDDDVTPAKSAMAAKMAWPKTLAEQARAVRAALAGGGATPAVLARTAFKGRTRAASPRSSTRSSRSAKPTSIPRACIAREATSIAVGRVAGSRLRCRASPGDHSPTRRSASQEVVAAGV